MLRQASIFALASAFVLPLASAHWPHVPQGFYCDPFDDAHWYVSGAGDVDGNLQPVASITWQTTVLLFDGCTGPPLTPSGPFDGDPELGMGGGFLFASHHEAVRNGVCVTDQLYHNTVGFRIGSDLNGDGTIDVFTPTLVGCGYAVDSFGFPIQPGPVFSPNPGWWVFLETRVDTTTAEAIVPTIGHICSNAWIGFPTPTVQPC